ncbi:hypothetical protein MASR2M15_01290 [Anaerolineales bacterium]
MHILFFALFSITLLGIYISIRRHYLPTKVTIIGGLLLSIVFMFLFSLSQNNHPLHALLVGVILGGVFCVVIIALALYFEGNALQNEIQNDGEQQHN